MQKLLRIEVYNIFTARGNGDEDHNTHMVYLGKIFSSTLRVR